MLTTSPHITYSTQSDIGHKPEAAASAGAAAGGIELHMLDFRAFARSLSMICRGTPVEKLTVSCLFIGVVVCMHFFARV